MTTEKVILICAAMMFLEYLYVKQNATALVAQAVTSSAPGALGEAAGAAVINIGQAIAGAMGNG